MIYEEEKEEEEDEEEEEEEEKEEEEEEEEEKKKKKNVWKGAYREHVARDEFKAMDPQSPIFVDISIIHKGKNPLTL